METKLKAQDLPADIEQKAKDELKGKAEYGYCPNCTCQLIKNPKHAQGIFECTYCKGRFLILETTKPTELSASSTIAQLKEINAQLSAENFRLTKELEECRQNK